MNYIYKNGVEIRLSNATVESWFKTIKVDIFQGNLRQKCGRILRTMRERVKIICKHVECKIRKKRMTRPVSNSINKQNAKKIKLEASNDNIIDAVEQWGKKEKPSKHLKSKSFHPFNKVFVTEIPIGGIVRKLDIPSQSPRDSTITINMMIKSSMIPFNQTKMGCFPKIELYDNGLAKKLLLPNCTTKKWFCLITH